MRPAIKYFSLIALTLSGYFATGCGNDRPSQDKQETESGTMPPDTAASAVSEEIVEELTGEDIRLEKRIRYDKYQLDDEYPYKDTVRRFQWNKIKEKIAVVENANREGGSWGVLSNYRNMNREAPTLAGFRRNEYGLVTDTFGVERYQSAPLYSFDADTVLVRYGRDGWLAKIIGSDTVEMIRIEGVSFDGEYLVPKRYLKSWGDTLQFNKAVAVDVTNQNIATLEKQGEEWDILSMNPATTGVHNPPYAHETPTGIFAVQEKKVKMFYTKDGSSEIAGYAPYASRFTNGGYVHGVPTNGPKKPIIEYSQTLGTIPRSHMCVRNASSHSKFVFDWATVKESVVIVID